jgi:hypothetical protein
VNLHTQQKKLQSERKKKRKDLKNCKRISELWYKFQRPRRYNWSHHKRGEMVIEKIFEKLMAKIFKFAENDYSTDLRSSVTIKNYTKAHIIRLIDASDREKP